MGRLQDYLIRLKQKQFQNKVQQKIDEINKQELIKHRNKLRQKQNEDERDLEIEDFLLK